MAVATYTKSGSKATTSAKLDKAVFGVAVTNHELLKQAYQAYLANGRVNLAKTLRRGEVSGGGKKPWKQKGTGRARFGSIRVPIWRGGGITFGPLGEENYSKNLPTNMKRTALRQALSLKAQASAISIIEDFAVKDGKTSTAHNLIGKLDTKGDILLVVDSKTDELTQATNNLPNVQLVRAQYLNVYDLLNANSIVMTQKSLDVVHEWLKPAKGGDR